MDEDKKKKLDLLRGLEKLKMAPVKKEGYTSPLDQDTIRVKGKSPSASQPETRFKNTTDHIDTKQIRKIDSPSGWQSKIQALLKNSAAKKALGVLPMAGTIAGLVSGDPAMAAEEAAGDIPGVGQAYEAVKSGDAGQSPEDEKMMLAEDAASKDYGKSPARLDKLKAMIGNRAPAAESPRVPIDANKATTLSGVDLQQAADNAQLEKDSQGDPSLNPNDPNSEKNLRLRKLMQQQLSNRTNR